MILASLALATAMQQAPKAPEKEVNPLRLKITRTDEMSVKPSNWYNLNAGSRSSLDSFLAEADNKSFVFIGESHDHPMHHQIQAQVIEGLVKRGRNVIVGFEMFTRPNQENLAPWTLGKWSDDEFIEKADWQKQWGFPYALYKPIFDVIKQEKLPMVALNVPREWVRAVGKGGLKSLTQEQEMQVPTVATDNINHKAVFTGLMGGHPMEGPQGDNIYAAQCLWDEGMADTAIKYVTHRYGSPQAMPKNTVFVIVAGMGHGLYKQGINWRIKRRTGMDTLTLINIEGDQAMPISRGVGDFVYVAPAFVRK